MLTRQKTFLQKHRAIIAILFALIGGVNYTLQSWEYAHHLSTIVWDESMYLYKGYLFAIGKYRPFEDFGPLTNQMPLAFLVPGYIQKWFGPRQ